MNEPKWTPGPWECVTGNTGNTGIVCSLCLSRTAPICYLKLLVETVGGDVWLLKETGQNDKANGDLIAAAPELYEALEICLLLFAKDHAIDRFDWGKSGLRAEDIRELNEVPLKIRAAMAKARGEQA
jgi:hypothetical protein